MDDLVQNFVSVFRRWSDFSSRARRREFWMFFLGLVIAYVVLGIITAILPRLGSAVIGLLALAAIVPTLAVQVRRLHDTGRSGWWLLLNIVPLGSLVLLYFWVQDSQPGTNEYGPNPKETAFAYAV